AYPLHQKIENAFDQSEVLIVEANVNDIAKLDIQKLVESAMYAGPETLERHVSAETYELIKKETGRLGIPLELINRQKPWFLALVLESLELLKLGFDPNYGIDKYFLSRAAEKKKIVELESLDYQIDLLSKFSDQEQELFLLYTVKDLRVLRQELDRLTQAWISGDAKGMESIMTRGFVEDSRMSSVYEKLILERNRSMASKIEEFLRNKEIYFAVVGAAHLVGNQGIIEILKGKGYLVEQL
ncbi:MAG TPA: TraB/GumN family protein, partial [Thermodesulfobacteriota bacterium]|nr:TraB/GumN family protein [Thermodesulfobacteriota bacterium]